MYNHRLLTRRHALWLGLATVAGMSACAKGKSIKQDQQVQVVGKSERDFTVTGETSLKERAAAKGLIYGASGRYRDLSSNSDLADHYTQECAILVPGNDLKWPTLRPSPDRFDFTKGDWLANFAHTHGMLFRGHTLVWNQGLPKWFQETVNKQNAEHILVEHIQKVARHYAGQMHSWDVVNEAVYPKHQRSDSLRRSPWLKFLGSDYIDLAFRAAAEADPQTILVYNDVRMNTDTEDGEATRIAILKLLERLKSRGTPVHALGMQAHLWAKDQAPLNPRKIRAFVGDVADLGLKIMVTELDVKDQHLPKDTNVRDRIVAGAYEDYLSAVLDEPAVISVITWGLSDPYSWRAKPQFGGDRKDGTPVRPLPLDAQMKRKLAWNAIARALDNAPKR
ncbi:MAG: endo-1,4-beta-xylanase [Symploca sp. SIO1C4]|uniref:Beta-xylanase n=1 Tax=Symploca sp. SIO1C4 TaxID=2607765 RepID=A0A6B3NC34_9CYAN|nr:endo-1,4-beta-xylanase [Symploca sp. SIO1C4]NET04124.1 endo-1,4-beta-xylanase [Symploca sp. SIO2B6]